jgi:hypothetical protein
MYKHESHPNKQNKTKKGPKRIITLYKQNRIFILYTAAGSGNYRRSNGNKNVNNFCLVHQDVVLIVPDDNLPYQKLYLVAAQQTAYAATQPHRP